MLNVIILAAGKGTRMHSDIPKVLHALAGKPMLQHVMDTALQLDASNFCVVYGHGGEAVPQAMGQYQANFVLQEPQLGTGHAVQQAAPKLQDGTMSLVLYGDVPLIQPATLKKLLQHRDHLNLLTLHMDNPTGYGRIIRDAQQNVTSIVEEKDASAEQKSVREVNTGILSAPTHLLKKWLANLKNNNAQGEYYLTDIVAMAVSEGIKVSTSQPDHGWEVMGVNSKVQLAELERIWQGEQALRIMQQGVTLADPARIDIRGKLVCGRDVEIDVGCIFDGEVHLGNRVKVGAYSVIKSSKIEAGTHIAPFSHIESSEVGSDNRIGPFSRLRPGAKLHAEVHIGNFVEVKNSEIAAGSKANHLSYVGDSSVGSKVNIGAGTITANYDGVNKHRTEIGDGASIGSNCVLVAPVTIGKEATIGAGSVITVQAPAGELTVARNKPVTIPGWKRPVKQHK